MPKKSAETMLTDRKSTRLNSSHTVISYAVFCLRSEEHTSELQSHSDLVCRLLLEKKKHTSELQSHSDLVCRLLLEKKAVTSRAHHHLDAADAYPPLMLGAQHGPARHREPAH